MKVYPLAILITDLHLSQRPPRCRAGESDWFTCMANQLREIKDLAAQYNCPVVCAGDIFHTWNAPAELIQFALNELPDRMYCIPGNHDLPYHDLKQINRSAYGVLKTVSKIVDLPPGTPIKVSDKLELVGFPWGTEIKNPKKPKQADMRMAVAHAYIWDDQESGHPAVTNATHYKNYRAEFDKFDVVHLGDNHTFWRNRNTVNLGSFMRRTVNDGTPHYGVLINDELKVRSFPLKSAKKDIVDELSVSVESGEDFSEYLESLRASAENRLDFRENMERWMEENNLNETARQFIYRAMEDAK